MNKGKKSKILTLTSQTDQFFKVFDSCQTKECSKSSSSCCCNVEAPLLNRNESQELCVGGAGSFYGFTSIFISQDVSRSSCEALPIKILTFTCL